MTTKETKISINKTARIAGILYLIIVILSFGGLLVDVSGDAATTANNIMASEGLFRLSIVGDLIVQTVHILLVLVLYKLLKPVNKSHAVLMVVFGLLSVPLAMLNQLNRFAPLLLLNGADYLIVFSTDQLQALALLFLDFHAVGIHIAYIFWGIWLFPLGYLVFKSGYIPKILGILLMIACFGYLIDFATFFLFPNFAVAISVFTFIGEVLLPLWLLIKGVNVEQWEKRALESA